MEPDGIEDLDAVRRGRYDPGAAQIPEGARDDLPHGSDGVGQVLLGYLRRERRLLSLLRGFEIEDVDGYVLFFGRTR